MFLSLLSLDHPNKVSLTAAAEAANNNNNNNNNNNTTSKGTGGTAHMGTLSGCAQPRTRFGTFRASVRKAQELGGCNKCNMEFIKPEAMSGRSSDYVRFEVLNQLAAQLHSWFILSLFIICPGRLRSAVGESINSIRPFFHTPIGSMGLVYLPTFNHKKSTLNVGKYTMHRFYGTLFQNPFPIL